MAILLADSGSGLSETKSTGAAQVGPTILHMAMGQNVGAWLTSENEANGILDMVRPPGRSAF